MVSWLLYLVYIHAHFSHIAMHIIVNAENTGSLENGIIDREHIETVDVPGMFI